MTWNNRPGATGPLLGNVGKVNDTVWYASARRRLLTVALVSALIGIGYYAVTLPPITTAAHISALLLGIGIYSIVSTSLSQRG